MKSRGLSYYEAVIGAKIDTRGIAIECLSRDHWAEKEIWFRPRKVCDKCQLFPTRVSSLAKTYEERFSNVRAISRTVSVSTKQKISLGERELLILSRRQEFFSHSTQLSWAEITLSRLALSLEWKRLQGLMGDNARALVETHERVMWLNSVTSVQNHQTVLPWLSEFGTVPSFTFWCQGNGDRNVNVPFYSGEGRGTSYLFIIFYKCQRARD